MLDCLRDWWEGLFYKEPEERNPTPQTEEERAAKEAEVRARAANLASNKALLIEALQELGYNVLPDNDYSRVYVYKNQFDVSLDDRRGEYPEKKYYIKTWVAEALYSEGIKGDLKIRHVGYNWSGYTYASIAEAIPFDRTKIPTPDK